ncbi:MAG TPA: glycosyltransferase family A protein [Ktedonobacterales bacterium]|jgi:glycosyltransferase involved in cell wall biosynthesis
MHVTVCICTRNRGSAIAATLRSLAASSYKDFDAVIVDQSAAEDTEQAVHEVTAGDARFSYWRSQTAGLSVARNIALAHARGPIIAFTDDDCDVSPDWLALLVEYFRAYPDVGEICGEVRAISYDPAAGHIPAFVVRSQERISSPWAFRRARGIGANMAFRQESLRAVGPFDELLGAGAPLYSYEDGDMTYRILKAGYSVLNAPDAYVVHSGFRSWDGGGRALMYHAYLAAGALYMKYLRLGDLTILPTIAHQWLGDCISWKKLLMLRRGSGLANFLYCARGMRVSFQYQIDRRRRLYLPREQHPHIAAKTSDALASGAE